MGNISTDNFICTMMDKWLDAMENKTSDYGKRVVVKETFRVFVQDGEDESGNPTYNFTWNGHIYDPTNKVFISNIKLATEQQLGIELLTPERLEYLFTVAFSGIYCTPYDAKNFYEAFEQDYHCECDECGVYFGNDLDAFVAHLKETKHKDGIFKKYPNWKI